MRSSSRRDGSFRRCARSLRVGRFALDGLDARSAAGSRRPKFRQSSALATGGAAPPVEREKPQRPLLAAGHARGANGPRASAGLAEEPGAQGGPHSPRPGCRRVTPAERVARADAAVQTRGTAAGRRISPRRAGARRHHRPGAHSASRRNSWIPQRGLSRSTLVGRDPIRTGSQRVVGCVVRHARASPVRVGRGC